MNIPSHPGLMKIVVLNPKGGSGKSTLATNLSGYFASNGHPVALMDFDPQGSAMRWLQKRDKERPEIYGVAAYEHNDTITRSWQLRIPQHIRHLIIDTPAALQVQDLITGEIAFFKFPCEAGEVYEQPGGASHSPAKSPAAKSPAGVVAAAPPFHSPSSGMAE